MGGREGIVEGQLNAEVLDNMLGRIVLMQKLSYEGMIRQIYSFRMVTRFPFQSLA